MNQFCETCPHKEIPKYLKENFNKVVDTTFIECPTSDKKVVGCLIKNLSIEWVKFVQYLREHGAISEDEVKKLKNKGWQIDG